MPQYVLDTDIFSMWAVRHEPVYSKLMATKPKGIGLSIISVEELLDGWVRRLSRCKRVEFHGIYRSLARMVELLKDVEVVGLSESALVIYDRLRSSFRGKGRHDLLIASICIDINATLVTNNVRDFEFIQQLRWENWAKP